MGFGVYAFINCQRREYIYSYYTLKPLMSILIKGEQRLLEKIDLSFDFKN